MLDSYSQQAKMVLFIARARAGQRGSHEVGIKHLLEAIVMEDQEPERYAGSALGVLPVAGTIRGRTSEVRSNPFFSSQTAAALLTKLNETTTIRDQPVPTSEDLPVSEELERTLAAAEELSRLYEGNRVKPLHLLGAALAEPSDATQFFFEAGITRDSVLEDLREK
jgi:hypothetical protein